MRGQWFGAHSKRVASRQFLFLWLILLLSACAGLSTQTAPTGDAVRIENPTARPAPAGQNGAAYFTIINPTGEDDHLLSVTSPVAAFVEIHETRNDNGVLRMRHHADGLPVPARSTVTFAPGGNHLMLVDLRHELAAGQSFTVTLSFAKAGEMQVTVPVMVR
jgi:periplasmic copper chaperone A